MTQRQELKEIQKELLIKYGMKTEILDDYNGVFGSCSLWDLRGDIPLKLSITKKEVI